MSRQRSVEGSIGHALECAVFFSDSAIDASCSMIERSDSVISITNPEIETTDSLVSIADLIVVMVPSALSIVKSSMTASPR